MTLPKHAAWFTLLPMLALGAVCVWGGLHFGRRVEVCRDPAGREALAAFEAELRRDFDKLSHLYESHMRRITSLTSSQQTWLRSAAERIVGVRQVSLLNGDGSGDFDLEIGHGTASLPRPYIAGRPRPLATVPIPMLGDESEPDAAWLDEPGKPLFFYQHQRSSIVAILVEPELVATAMSRWLREEKSSALRQALVEAWSLEDSGGEALATGDAALPERAADVLLPLHTRFGAWRLRAWDRETTCIVWQTPILVATWGGAGMLALFGAGLFAQQRAALRRAEQRVSFVNQVSHELRTPITNLQLNTDLALELLDGTPPEAATRLALVRDETARLGRLVENVLTFSRAERGALRLHPRACVPAEVLRAGVLEPFARALERRGIRISVQLDPAPAVLDPDALTQIVANLVSNVEKYAASGGALDLQMERAGESLVVRVADRGSGIPAAMREAIFEPFRRLDSRTTEGSSGAGLGLAIARDLATRMGGTLRAVPSTEHAGACFELRVPCDHGARFEGFAAPDKLQFSAPVI